MGGHHLPSTMEPGTRRAAPPAHLQSWELQHEKNTTVSAEVYGLSPAGARNSPASTAQEYLFPCAWRPWAFCPAAWAGFRFANGIALPVCGKTPRRLTAWRGRARFCLGGGVLLRAPTQRQLPGTGRRKPGVNPRRHWRLAHRELHRAPSKGRHRQWRQTGPQSFLAGFYASTFGVPCPTLAGVKIECSTSQDERDVNRAFQLAPKVARGRRLRRIARSVGQASAGAPKYGKSPTTIRKILNMDCEAVGRRPGARWEYTDPDELWEAKRKVAIHNRIYNAGELPQRQYVELPEGRMDNLTISRVLDDLPSLVRLREKCRARRTGSMSIANVSGGLWLVLWVWELGLEAHP